MRIAPQKKQSDEERLWPRDNEAEAEFLGIIIEYGEVAESALALTTPQCFFLPEHKEICNALTALVREQPTPDLSNLRRELKKRGASEDALIHCEGVVKAYSTIPAHIPGLIKTLSDYALRRKVLSQSPKLVDALYDLSVPLGETLASWTDVGQRAYNELIGATGPSAVETCLGSELRREDLEEIWPRWIARNYVHIAGGDNESGKTISCMMVSAAAAGVVAFGDLDSKEGPLPPTDTLWIDTEGMVGEIQERARRWGLEPWLDHVHFWGESGIGQVDLLEEGTAEQIGYTAQQNDCGLVIIDGLAGANTGEENSANIRSVMQASVNACAKYKQAWLITQFTRKPEQILGKPRPTTSDLRGSSVISQFARVVILNYRPDPDKDEFEVFVAKRTFGGKPPSLGLYVSDTTVDFGEPPVAKGRERRMFKWERAAAWLQTFLADGPRLARDVYKEIESQDMGLSQKDIKTAKHRMHLDVYQDADKDAKMSWWWKLPAQEPSTLDFQGEGL